MRVECSPRPVRILLAEDNPADAYLVSEALRAASPADRLAVVPDGEQALDFLQRRGVHSNAWVPDLILLDLNLPRVSGLDVLKTIKSLAGLSSIPVIALSSSDARWDIEAAYQSGVNCYICKPSSLDGFYRLFRSLKAFWLDVALLPGRCSD